MLKKYPLQSSCLYRCKSYAKLARYLGVDSYFLRTIEANLRAFPQRYYRVFKVGEKQREIQQPINKKLLKVHRRLLLLISSIQQPDYLHSGVRGRSYITNASSHLGCRYTLTMDIEKFYASTKAECVFQFFLHDLQVAEDLASLLTCLCVYDDKLIPTGSSVSQILAYWAYHRVFDEINELAFNNNLKFTLYVDDMAFSSDAPILREFPLKVRGILRKKWLTYKPDKIVWGYPKNAKKITGCLLLPNNTMKCPNDIKKKAIELIRSLIGFHDVPTVNFQKAVGLMNSIQQVEGKVFCESMRQVKQIAKKTRTT